MAHLPILPSFTKLATLTTVFLLVVLINPCTAGGGGGHTLITQTCKQTPNYNLCVSTIAADPRAAKATNVETLALIMLDSVKAKATAASRRIQQLMKTAPSAMKKHLGACAEIYDIIITDEIPEAVQAVSLGDPKFGEEAMNDSAAEPSSCEDEFGGKSSPLTQQNQAVGGAAAVAAAIIRLLL